MEEVYLKKKRLINKKKNIFSSWLMSYMLILLVPILITGFVYVQAINVIEDEINKAHAASLRQLSEVIDDRLRDVEKLSLQVAWNDINKEIMYIKKDEINPSDTIKMVNLMKHFTIYKAAYGSINDFYVYYKQGDFILNSMGKYSTDLFYGFYHKNQGISYNDWMKIISSRNVKTYLPLVPNSGVESESKIIFLQTVPVESPDQAIGTVAIILNENSIKQDIEKTKWMSEGTVLILDKEGRIVTSTSNIDDINTLKYDRLNKTQDIFNSKINGQEVVISYTSSSVNDWKYVSILPTDVFLKKAKYVRKITYISIMLCLLVGMIISYFLTMRNYNPIRKIVNIFKTKYNGSEVLGYAGYDYIEESIVKILDENNEISKRLNQQNDVLKDNFLLRLIKGQVNDDILIHDACKSYGIEFISNKFVSMVIYIEDLNSHFLDNIYHNSNDISMIDIDDLKDLISSILPYNGKAYIAEVDGIICLLIDIGEMDSKDYRKNLLQFTNKLIKFMEQELGIYIAIAISSMHSAIEEVSRAYQESIETIEHKILLGGGQVVYYDDIKKEKDNDGIYDSQDAKKQFVNCIKSGDYKGAETTLDDIFHMQFFESCLSTNMVRYRMIGLINLMSDAIKESSISWDIDFINKLNVEERLINCKTVKQLRKQMNEILKEIENYIEDTKEKNEINLKKNVIGYVSQNYHDANLSVSMIADKFSVNDAYLSRFFKKQMGIGLLEYIHKVRIEESKHLLKSSDLSVNEISKKVGYYNSAAFIRVFKKYEGITPGKFSQINK